MIMKYTSQDISQFIRHASQYFEYISQDIEHSAIWKILECTSQDFEHTSQYFRIKQRFARF